METSRLARIMKALSNEHRVNLYFEIARHEEQNYEAPECTISDIVKLFGITPPTISHHLKELANAGLISTEKRGKHLVARINKKTLVEVKQMLSRIKGE